MSEPVTRRHRIRRWFDPREDSGMDLGHWILLLLLVVVVTVATTVALNVVSRRYVQVTPAFFAQRYEANVSVPTSTEKIPEMPGASLLPASGSIDTTHWLSAGDQGPIGSCAAWVTDWIVSFEFRVTHLSTHPGIKFSPKAMYDHYVSVYGGGQDSGSWWPQDAEIAMTTGLPQFKKDPYPPFTLGDGMGNFDLTDEQKANAAHFRFQVQVQTLSYSMGGGEGALNTMKTGILQGLPVALAIPIYPEFDAASPANDGFIPAPPLDAQGQPTEPERGGHGIIAIAFDDARHCATVQSSWSKLWGVNGRGCLDYDYIRRYAFGISTIRIGSAVTAGYFPPASAFGLSGFTNTVQSPYAWEAGLLGGIPPVQDTDYLLNYAHHSQVRLPGGRHQHWCVTQAGYIAGSGNYVTFRPKRHYGRMALLHLYRYMVNMNYGACYRGGKLIALSGWPSSFTYSGGYCGDWFSCEADAHLCLVTDWNAALWLYHIQVTVHHRVGIAPKHPEPPLLLPHPSTLPASKIPKFFKETSDGA